MDTQLLQILQAYTHIDDFVDKCVEVICKSSKKDIETNSPREMEARVIYFAKPL